MSKSVSIHDFEIWYRLWYSLQKSNIYTLETSVKSTIKEGDEISVYAYPIKNKGLVWKRPYNDGLIPIEKCLFKEKADSLFETLTNGHMISRPRS